MKRGNLESAVGKCPPTCTITVIKSNALVNRKVMIFRSYTRSLKYSFFLRQVRGFLAVTNDGRL